MVVLDLTAQYRSEKILKRERKLPKRFKDGDQIQLIQIILEIFKGKIYSIENAQKNRALQTKVDIRRQAHPIGHFQTNDLSKRILSKLSSTRTQSISGLFLILRLLDGEKTQKKKNRKRRFSRILQHVDFCEKRNPKKTKMIILKQLLL